jgi:hypothetical protein
LVIGIAAGIIDCQVRLRIFELSEEAVRELRGGSKDVDFVRIDIQPLALANAPHIA